MPTLPFCPFCGKAMSVHPGILLTNMGFRDGKFTADQAMIQCDNAPPNTIGYADTAEMTWQVWRLLRKMGRV